MLFREQLSSFSEQLFEILRAQSGHAYRDSPPLAKASRWNLSKFVVIKHLGWESLNVQSSCCLDVVVYMLNCVFWRHILLEIEFKSRRVDMGSDSNRYTAQRYSPWAAAQLSTPKKKPETGAFQDSASPTAGGVINVWKNHQSLKSLILYFFVFLNLKLIGCFNSVLSFDWISGESAINV